MHKPTQDPTDRKTYRSVTWTNILWSYALVAAIPVLLWAVSAPIAAGTALAGAAVAFAATRYAYKLARCIDQCRGLTFDLPRTGHVTVCWAKSCDPN